MKRTYHVVVLHEKGVSSWESECSGFGFFEKVSGELISKWEKSAKKQFGLKEAVVINFMRIK